MTRVVLRAACWTEVVSAVREGKPFGSTETISVLGEGQPRAKLRPDVRHVPQAEALFLALWSVLFEGEPPYLDGDFSSLYNAVRATPPAWATRMFSFDKAGSALMSRDPSTWLQFSRFEFQEGRGGCPEPEVLSELAEVLGARLGFESPRESNRDRSSVGNRPVEASNPHLELGLKSQEWLESSGDPDEFPLVVPKSEVLRSTSWPRWQQAQLVLEPGGLTLDWDGQAGKLEVDLTAAQSGIYSQQGKRFLADEYMGTSAQRRRGLGAGRMIQQTLLGGRARRIDCVGKSMAPALRWASGGYMPIVRWMDQDMVLLFFRDIPPIGWNIANGGSESRDEWFDLAQLASREAHEEIVILKPGLDGLSDATRQRPQLTSKGTPVGRLEVVHRDLRRSLDGTEWYTPETPLSSKLIDGPIDVCVSEGADSRQTNGAFLSVNPAELGAEVSFVGRFSLEDDWRVLDGETRSVEWNGKTHQALVRRPVGLFSLSYFRRVFNASGDGCGNPGELGVPLRSSGRQLDCRRLPPPKSDEYHVFPDDIERRRTLSDTNPRKWREERKWIDSWGTVFERALEGQFEAEISVMVPAAYRLIEQLITRGVVG